MDNEGLKGIKFSHIVIAISISIAVYALRGYYSVNKENGYYKNEINKMILKHEAKVKELETQLGKFQDIKDSLDIEIGEKDKTIIDIQNEIDEKNSDIGRYTFDELDEFFSKRYSEYYEYSR